MREMVNPDAASAFRERFASGGSLEKGLGSVGCMGCDGSRGCCVTIETPEPESTFNYKPDSPVPRLAAQAAFNAMNKISSEIKDEEIDPKTGKKKKKKKKQLVF